jgi:PAS domain S-box-containing protein
MNAFSIVDYEDIFMQAPIGMCVSRHRMIYSANNALADMFNCHRHGLVGKSLEILYPSPDEFERTGCRITAIIKNKGFYADERIMRRCDHELFWCHVTGRAQRQEDPHAAGIWTFEDVSSKRPFILEMTPREREIATLILEGKTSKLIARQIALSPRTVEMHRAKLMKKFSAATSSELVHKLLSLAC